MQRETCFKNEERQTSDKRDRSGEPHPGAEKLYKQCIWLKSFKLENAPGKKQIHQWRRTRKEWTANREGS